MQVQPPPQAAIQAAGSSLANILPGPFILLLLLPAIPLLLFSVGARPPDTHHLPFTTDDLWQTTAFITVAGAVVLAMGLYPGLLADISGWVKEGGYDGWATYLRSADVDVTTGRAGEQAYPGDHHRWGTDDRLQRDQPPQLRVRYDDVPRTPGRVEYRPESFRQDGQGNVFHRPAARKIVPPSGGGRRPVYETIPAQALHNPTHAAVGSTHLAKLRTTPWYSPNRPSLPVAALCLILTVALLIALSNKLLSSAYVSDTVSRKAASKGEDVDAWYIRELSKRKRETEKETVTRNKAQEAAFVGRLKKMDREMRRVEVGKKRKELEILRKELGKRKMPLVGLDWELGDGKSRAGGKSGTGKGSKGEEKTRKGKEKEARAPDTKGEAAVDAKPPGKLKKLLLGPLASGPKDRSKSRSAAGGPGWKPADDAVAHAAIRGGAIRAESMANDLVAQKG